ncbi:gliding motility-associated C-terminal domain-containing protein [Flavobacterium aestivum]|uniref:T9SS type B sorting domain-containing protein n=1 Tax=Flavobacterium aestivum TaxID=3003257 RepID=UPI0024825178|nr:gliding motility-associated C-terminal domain-containing protein [Flavobacterium aestivum]
MKKKYIHFLLLLFLFLFPRFSANAQVPSTPVDFEFWFGVPGWAPGYNSPQKIHFTGVGTGTNTYAIDMPANAAFNGGTPLTGTVAAGGSAIVDMSSFIAAITVSPANSIVDRGLRIRIWGQMGAYYANETGNNYGTIPLRGPNALGTSFIVPGQNLYAIGGAYAGANAETVITATEDNTIVTVTPSEAIIGHGANVPFNITLNKGQSYRAESTTKSGKHLAGTTVTSTKLVVVTYSDDLIQAGGAADNGGDQLVPVSKLGNAYVHIRTNLSIAESIFLTGSQNGTTITIFDGTTTTTRVVDQGQMVRYDLPAGKNAAYISSDKPISAYQLGGAGAELGSGILTPVASCKGISSLAFQYPTSASSSFFNIVVPSGSEDEFTVTSNGVAVPTAIMASDFVDVPGLPGWKYMHKQMNTIPNISPGRTLIIKNTNPTSGKFLFYQNMYSTAGGGGGDFSNFSDFGNVVLFPTANHVCGSNTLELKSGSIQYNTTISSYSWTGPNGFTSNISDPVLSSYTAADMGTYVLTVTDSNGCTYTENLTVNLPMTDITVSPNNPTACTGAAVHFTSVPVPAEAVPTSISWTGPNGFTSTEANFDINTLNASHEGTYTCTYIDKYGCLISKSTTLTVDPSVVTPFTVTILGSDKLNCGTPSVSLSAAGYTAGLNYETYSPYDATSLFTSSDFTTIVRGFYNQNPTNIGVASQMNLTGLTGITPASSTAYGVKYKGFINITNAGTYTFYTNSKDGSNLYIDGSLRVSNDGGHTITEVASTAFSLTAGYHTIEMNYFDSSSGAGALSVSYQGPSIAKTAIPASVLFHSGGSASGSLTYSWTNSNNATVVNGNSLSVTVPGTYTLTGTSAGGGCSSSYNYEVKKIDDYDYNDLTSTWPVAQAKILSCITAGVPSGNNGAVWAGSGVSIETSPLRNVTATADTFDDGLSIPSTSGTTITTNISLNSNTPGTTVNYGLWFDWNNDGDFSNDVDGNGNSAFYNGSGTAGSTITATVVAPAGASSTYKTRLIVASIPIDFTGYDDIYTNGEVEDYANLQLSGTVFNDANGLNGSPANTVNGTGTNAGGLTAVLVNSSGNVVANAIVAANGTYNFSLVSPIAGTYSIVLSTTAGTVGSPAPSASLPSGWVNTGENLGTAAGNDGSVNGILTNVTIGITAVANANFGIDNRPVANSASSCQVDPGGNTKVSVPVLTGTDIEDGTYNGTSSTNTIKIVTLPTNGVLYYNNVAVTAGQIISNYNPNLLTVDPNAGFDTISFTFSEIDAAGVESLPASVTVSTAYAGPDQSTFVGLSATMAAVGTGTWTALGSNPDPVTINDPTSPTTTITGFDTPSGVYNFIWTNTNGCTDTAIVGTPLSVIIANDDVGTPVNGLTGGTSLTNVLSNDTLNGNQATTLNVNIFFGSSTNAGISLSGTDVVVAPGTPAGNYTLTYRICEKTNPTNCEDAIVTVPVIGSDLAVVKTINNPTPTIGTNATFTITATNNGPVNATGVNIVDTLPSGYSFVSATPSTGTWTAPNWSIGNLANGASASLVVVAKVNASGSYANTAIISGNESDTVPANNTSTVTPAPVSSCDLSVVKTVSTSTPTVGANVTFTITATNNGPSDATGVNVAETLPTGYTLANSTPSVGTYNGTTWAIGNLASGTSATLTVVAIVNASGSYANTAIISGNEPDPTLPNNTSTSTPTPVASSDLSVVKTVSNGSPVVGTNVTFTITATNNGPSNATGVNVAETLPAGYTFVSATPSVGTYNGTTWAIGNLANGVNETLTIVARVNASGPYANTVSISGNEPDPALPNNTSTVTPLPVFSTDLSVVKTVNTNSPIVGTNVTFTITATNNGPSDATNVNVAETLPSGYTFVNATASAGTYNGTTNWAIGNLANGASATLTIVATVNATGSYTNSVIISGAEPDPTTPNNTSTVTPIPVASSDLSVVKTTNLGNPIVGTNITFTIRATNNGPSDATGVNVAETLPTGYTFVSATPSVGTYNGTTWAIGNLANGANETLTIVATVIVSATNDYANTASISGNETDPVTSNNTSTVTPTATPNADISVVKTVSTNSPRVGTNVTFTIAVTNNGPSDATGVTVAETLPSGYTLVSASPSVGSYDGTTTWTIGNMLNGASATLTIVAKVNVSVTNDYANTASISGSDPVDLDPTNNTSTSTPTPVASSDLSVVKTVSTRTPIVGTDVSFTITATNNGPSDATNVNVQDVLPSGYTFVSATPSTGTWTAPNWTIGNLANGASATITIVATVKASGPYDNTATISGTETDPEMSNNTSTAEPIVPIFRADLSIVKTINTNSPIVGTNVSFTITATNNGPSDATNVNVAETLPTGYTFISASQSAGSYDGTSTWAIGNLANGASATLTIVARVNNSGPYTNTVTISGNEPDPTLPNNTSTVTPVPVFSSDLSVVKTVSTNSPIVGTNVTFTITATNNGPSDATNVNVAETLPSGYTFVNATPSMGTYDGTTWAIGNLANGTSATLTIVATVNATGSYANSVTISGAEPDPTSPNNTSTVTPLPVPSSNLAVNKVVSTSSPIVGTNVTFTITATNNGPSDATGVKVDETLPTGYTFVSATPSVGTYNGTIWTIGNLANGANETLTIIATVNASGSYTNSVSISGNELDPALPNNTSTVTPAPVFSSDLAVDKQVSNGSPVVGTNVTFTITATNNGPSDATGVKVTETLPTGYTFVSANPSVGTYNGTTWTIGNLANGATETLSIVATVIVSATNDYTNTASISGNESDPVFGNNSSIVTPIPVSSSDLAVVKTVSTGSPTVGSNVTFTITATNNGPSNATGVNVAETLPTGYTFVSANPSVGTYNGTTWTIGNLANGATETLSIVATVIVSATNDYTNTASISGNESDPVSGNNSSIVTPIPVSSSDLAVVKTVSTGSPTVGSNVTFTITATNNGPSNATGVNVAETLPTGYIFVSANPSVGTYNGTTWTIGNLANGANATLTIVAKVIASATNDYTNSVSISGNESDPTMGNNTSASTPTPVSSSDLAVTKTVDNPTPNVGDNVTFTLTATNSGPSDATGVQVTELLQSGYTFVSATAAVGTTYNNTTGLWTIGNLLNGGSVVLTVTAKVNESGVYTNTATISGNQPDPVSNNNNPSVTPAPAHKIAAVRDDYTANPVSTSGGVLSNVTSNDKLNGQPVNPANVDIKLVNPPSSGFSVDANGNITIPPGLDVGTHTLEYQICDKLNPNNCSITIVEFIVVDACDLDDSPASCDIVVHNAFTPNEDGTNDHFHIDNIERYKTNRVQIYNIWGVLVYERNGYDNTTVAFKGYSEGRTTINKSDGLPDGTYYYVIEYTKANNVVKNSAGYLYLTR